MQRVKHYLSPRKKEIIMSSVFGDTIACAILAGGKNTRMNGRDKAFLNIKGIPVIDKILNILKNLFEEIIIVSNTKKNFETYLKECIVISDVIQNIGPLGGIHSALFHTTKEAVFFVACDMPYLHNEIIISQIDHFNKVNRDALVPRINNLIEPLHAIYRTALNNDIVDFINHSPNYSIKCFLNTINNAAYWDLEDTPFHKSVFQNLNTPEDFMEVSNTNES